VKQGGERIFKNIFFRNLSVTIPLKRSRRALSIYMNTVFIGVSLKLTHYRPAMPIGNRKKIEADLFSSLLSKLKKYHLSGNLKMNNLGVFQSLKLRNLVLRISLELNFIPNTLDCNWLTKNALSPFYLHTCNRG